MGRSHTEGYARVHSSSSIRSPAQVCRELVRKQDSNNIDTHVFEGAKGQVRSGPILPPLTLLPSPAKPLGSCRTVEGWPCFALPPLPGLDHNAQQP